MTPGNDEVWLALVVDAWSRTSRTGVVTFAGSTGVLKSRSGIRILPDQVATNWPPEHQIQAIGDRPQAIALDRALHGTTTRYGMRTADFVAMQLEYSK